jgi:hypothetical protein
MSVTKITRDGKYLAQCSICGTWIEVHPQTHKAELFFEVLEAGFQCCGRQQSATFTREKDTLDFH